MFGRLRRNIAWRADLKTLDAQIGREPRPHLAAPAVGSNGAPVWRLAVPKKADAFMTLTTGQADPDFFVVPVWAVAFHRAWLSRGLQSDDLPDGCRLRSELSADRKYRHAAACFAAGEKNPVELPRVGVTKSRGGKLGVTFTDGITRTFWLLANNVAAFPVLVADPESAIMLAKAVGLAEPQRAAELFAAGINCTGQQVGLRC